MSAFVYILRSLKNNNFYIGSTENLNQRFLQHNKGVIKATKYKRPYEIVFYQEFDNLLKAKSVEKTIKKWKRKDFIEKIIKDGKINITGR